MKRSVPAIVIVVLALSAFTACKSTYYAAYEKLGVYKRDLLKKDVVAARDEQKQAGQQFKDALTRLKELTGYEGGELERRYRGLQSDYDGCAQRAQAVRNRIAEVETVAKDLFAEWNKEIKEITTESIRSTSRRELRETRERYDQMITALKKAESSMSPVLAKFHDYVLAVKHSLNAQAIASLQNESVKIQNDIAELLEDMNTSIARADEFVKGLR